jgi:gas vesicle protein
MNLTAPWNATNGHSNGTHEKIDEVRDVLSREADHLAEVAAQFGRDATTHVDGVARDVAKDAQKQTNAAVKRLGDIAATWAPAIAAMGQQRIRQTAEQAQSIGKDLSKVRITTEPKRNDGAPGIAMLGGLGIGLGLGIATMYLLDPERGRERRAALKARFDEWLNSGRERINSMSESITSGISADDQLPASDETSTYQAPSEAYSEVANEASSYETWPQGTRVPTN